MTQKLVSICIPAYRQTQFLKKCLDSVFLQTYQNYEVIISDDTPDDSVKKFVEKNYGDKTITYFQNQVSLGSPANWNFVVSKVKGDYVKIMHHDDYFTFNDSLEKFVKKLETKETTGFVFSLSRIYNATNGHTWTNSISDDLCEKIKFNPTSLINGNLIGSPSACIFKRNEIVFDEKMKWLVDVDFYIATLIRNNNFSCIKEPLITTTNLADHQVTQLCIGNPEVELFEFCYIVDKYSRRIDFNNELEKVFLNLFYNYNIDNIARLSDYYKNAFHQSEFYVSVFRKQKTYNKIRRVKSKIKYFLEKFIKK